MENFPNFYLDKIKSWSKLLSILNEIIINRSDILDRQLFRKITFQYNKNLLSSHISKKKWISYNKRYLGWKKNEKYQK